MLQNHAKSARQVTQYVPATWRKRSRWLANQRRDWIDWIDDATRDAEPKAKLGEMCEAERSHVRAKMCNICSAMFTAIWSNMNESTRSAGILSPGIRCGAGLCGLLHWWLWTFVLQNHLSKTRLQSSRQRWYEIMKSHLLIAMVDWDGQICFMRLADWMELFEVRHVPF